MKARLVFRERVQLVGSAFVELVLWEVPKPLRGSVHSYKYRFALIVDQICVLRYDNEAGKGDHRHVEESETSYRFTTTEQLRNDFWKDVREWLNKDAER